MHIVFFFFFSFLSHFLEQFSVFSFHTFFLFFKTFAISCLIIRLLNKFMVKQISYKCCLKLLFLYSFFSIKSLLYLSYHLNLINNQSSELVYCWMQFIFIIKLKSESVTMFYFLEDFVNVWSFYSQREVRSLTIIINKKNNLT